MAVRRFAQEPWQLLAARALQGVGGAIASPTSLALITTRFPEGPERNRAFGVLNATQQVGGSLGLSILVTVFGTASRTEGEKQVADFLATATPEQQAEFLRTKEVPAPWSHEVLSSGIATAFTAGVAMVAVALLAAVLVIRVRRSDLEALSGTAEAAGPVA
ncbi:MFS transporter [Streptomyces sp. NRRL F-5727]|uniref:MFS transporter n=1 Tax=Streptomyces sp. NRRL F-5727 TaxID=1463871 RepID=UPI0004CA3BE9|nr:MFS transporter [Streptomyces sp. NRRL F-5727]